MYAIRSYYEEQNEVIRNTENEILIVEGPAGCGKTSVALHRIAYLLYKFRESLKAREILIFSPNKIFTEYISSVLPDLGRRSRAERPGVHTSARVRGSPARRSAPAGVITSYSIHYTKLYESRKTIEDKFNWEKNVNQLIGVYEELL